MTETERNERITLSRTLIRWEEDETAFETDQELRRKQPPLFKEPMTDSAIALPRNFENLTLETDFVRIINDRRSSRVFTMEDMSLLQLSFLLWGTQGIKGIRGKQYATLRTVPSGGARHPFELYVACIKVEGLESGIYHYIAQSHSIERIASFAENALCDGMCGQKWACKANAVLFYSIVPYRGEWRYSYNAHRVMMMDAGHAMENVYLCASAMKLGACAIGAVNHSVLDSLFGLDGEEEFVLCCVPVGTVSDKNEKEEKDFYAFLNTEEQFYH